MPLLLTLDLARNIGFTIGEVSNKKFASGSFLLPQTEVGEIASYAVAYHDWLSEKLRSRGQVDMVVFEAPILFRHDKLASVRKLHGLCWHTEFCCGIRAIPCYEAPVLAVRKFIGVTKVKNKDKKLELMECIQTYGFHPQDHDEADAIAIRLYTIARMFPGEAKAFNLDLGLLGAAAPTSRGLTPDTTPIS